MWMVPNEILSSYVIKRPIYQKNPKDLILIPNPDKFSQFPPQYIFTSGDTSHTTLAMCLTKENAVSILAKQILPHSVVCMSVKYVGKTFSRVIDFNEVYSPNVRMAKQLNPLRACEQILSTTLYAFSALLSLFPQYRHHHHPLRCYVDHLIKMWLCIVVLPILSSLPLLDIFPLYSQCCCYFRLSQEEEEAALLLLPNSSSLLWLQTANESEIQQVSQFNDTMEKRLCNIRLHQR